MSKFTINKDQRSKINHWLKRHDQDCVFKKTKKEGATDGRLTYKFTPTKKGMITAVHCLCGKKINLTNWS